MKLSSGLEDKWQTLASFSLERHRELKTRGDFPFMPSTVCLDRLQCHLKKKSVTLNDRHVLVRPGPLNSM